ncbi:homoserine dehydrogenase [Treponema phagedenis]|uniref:homoserine dehydrogenase n=1 Tax=Treponema phagedenis TaxID=162 RepID=UPI0001F63FA5|nr:homoserine dehydrogenase [Treponema phagedenis]EFW37206.1 homoserine dehydrogenase [Treponema phagedenis F0421]TYT79316.1 homoserine dehydrogenase [Treponema phagedenis]
MRTIGILGFGTVGKSVYDIFNEQKTSVEKALGSPAAVKKILVRDIEKHRRENPQLNLFTQDINEVIEDPEINTVIEVTGGAIFPAIKQAMINGKDIITANKALVSAHMEELHRLADEHRVELKYEASVGGAIPVIEKIADIKCLNEITGIQAVLNGTCNYILTAMENKLSFAEALEKAQAQGFAEADPSADIDGLDTMRKLRILASLAFGIPVREQDIAVEGIRAVGSEEVLTRKAEGLKLKLIAEAHKTPEGIRASVKPVPVPAGTVLGSLVNGENAVIIHCSNAGTLTFKGLGAGGRPTAFSVLKDLLNLKTR